MSNRIHRTHFGNLVGLRPIPSSSNNNNLLASTEEPPTIPAARVRKYTRNDNNKATKTMKISGQLHQRFLDHSRKYYNAETYEIILENLLDCYEKHNSDKRYCGDKLPLPK